MGRLLFEIIYDSEKSKISFGLSNPNWRKISIWRVVSRKLRTFCSRLANGRQPAVRSSAISSPRSIVSRCFIFKANSYTTETLVSKLARIEENIQRYLEEMDQLDKNEPDDAEISKEKLQAKIDSLRERQERYEGYQKQMEESGEQQLLTTDPDARVMQSKDGYHCYYNVQTAVDSGSHLIAAYEVTNCCTDQGLLKDVADEARMNLEVETLTVVADKGYDSRKDVEKCFQNGIVPT